VRALDGRRRADELRRADAPSLAEPPLSEILETERTVASPRAVTAPSVR
jgi:hypothetical protein